MDTFDAILRSMNLAMKEVGIGTLTADELRPLIGRDIASQLATLRGIQGGVVTSVRDLYYQEFVKEVAKGVRLYPGVQETFGGLGGYVIGTMTTRRRSVARLMLDKAGLLSYFTEIVGGDEVSRPKPDPELVHLSCRALGVEPKESIAVGDSPVDILAGRTAGCLAVAATYGYGDKEELMASAPHATITNFSQLPRVLDRLKTTSRP